MKYNIPKDKEESIYQAALTEFAKEGYKKASTNNIVKNCNVSKGSLFNYFNTKKDLYIYVVNKSLKAIEDEMTKYFINLSDDFFERIDQCQKIKMNAITKFYREGKIIVDAYELEDEDVANQINYAHKYYEKIGEELYLKDIDRSKFKDNIDINLVYKTMLYISYGFTDSLVRKYRDSAKLVENIKDLRQELFEIINMLKKSFYKGESNEY